MIRTRIHASLFLFSDFYSTVALKLSSWFSCYLMMCYLKLCQKCLSPYSFLSPLPPLSFPSPPLASSAVSSFFYPSLPFFLSHLSSSTLSFLSSLLSLIPENQSWAFLWMILLLVLVKEEVFSKYFTVYMPNIICLKNIGLLSALAASILWYLQSQSCIWQSLYNIFLHLFCFVFLFVSGTLPLTQLSYLSSWLIPSVFDLGSSNLLPPYCYLWLSTWLRLLLLVPLGDTDQDDCIVRSWFKAWFSACSPSFT